MVATDTELEVSLLLFLVTSPPSELSLLRYIPESGGMGVWGAGKHLTSKQ